MIKKIVKILKVYGINVFPHWSLPLKEGVLYTWLNMDNHGQPLNHLCKLNEDSLLEVPTDGWKYNARYIWSILVPFAHVSLVFLRYEWLSWVLPVFQFVMCRINKINWWLQSVQFWWEMAFAFFIWITMIKLIKNTYFII